MEYDGNEILDEVVSELQIDLPSLVAGSAFWAPNLEGVGKAKHPNVRRFKKGSEKRRETSKDGMYLDDNTIANKLLKNSLSYLGSFKHFAVCHIWPETCYDERYHTVLANLVLVPRALSSLTDHNEEIEKCLQYRAWELYKWKPDKEDEPVKPENYPNNWRLPGSPPDKANNKEKSSGDRNKRGARNALQITLQPADKAEFANAFIQKGAAKIIVTFSDGQEEEATWTRKKFSDKSDVIANIRSHKDLRQGGKWQQRGIEKVEVKVE